MRVSLEPSRISYSEPWVSIFMKSALNLFLLTTLSKVTASNSTISRVCRSTQFSSLNFLINSIFGG